MKLCLRVPGQRHQPHYNIRQERKIVEQSVMNVFRLYVAFDHIDKRLASDPHFYGKAVWFMQDNYKYTGVYGAGALTGQHLIHIGVLCGLFPVGLIEHAEIGETTKSYKHLSAWEGMTDHMEDTRQLLKCLSVRLGLPLFIVENILCKFGQDQISRPPTPKWQAATAEVWKKKKKSSPYTDSVYRDQIGLYLFDDKKRHLTVTKDGIIYDKPLAGQCHPLNPKFSSHVSVGAVLYAYWERKVSGRRVIPMTTATREYLNKRGKSASTQPEQTNSKSSPPEPTSQRNQGFGSGSAMGRGNRHPMTHNANHQRRKKVCRLRMLRRTTRRTTRWTRTMSRRCSRSHHPEQHLHNEVSGRSGGFLCSRHHA